MARIVLADDGIDFDGHTPEERPLGGVESSVVALMQELAARGHEVHVLNNCKASLDHLGVKWRPIDGGPWPEAVDLYIAIGALPVHSMVIAVHRRDYFRA